MSRTLLFANLKLMKMMSRCRCEVKFRYWLLVLSLLVFATLVRTQADDASRTSESKATQTASGGAKPKKSITDYTDAEIERIFDQWEENDEPVDPRDLSEFERRRRDPLSAPRVDLTKVDLDDKDEAIRLLKKGQTVMMFIQLTEKSPSGADWSDYDVNLYGQRWQTDLFNAHIDVQRYNVAARRILFVVSDGALSMDVKKYLVRQKECEYVMIEGVQYDCAGKPKPKSEL